MAMFMTALEALSGMQTELFIFIVAVCTHAVLFGSYRFKPSNPKAKVSKSIGSAEKSGGSRAGSGRLPDSVTTTSLIRTVKPLLRQAAGTKELAGAIHGLLKDEPREEAAEALPGLLDSVGRANADLLAAVRNVSTNLGLEQSARLQELLMKNFLGLKLQGEFDDVLREAKAAGNMTALMAMLSLRSSLTSSDLEAALECLPTFASLVAVDAPTTVSAAPQQLLQQLVRLAGQKGAMPSLLTAFEGCNLLNSWTLETVLSDCGQRRDIQNLNEVAQLARSRGVELTETAYAGLIRGSTSGDDALCLFNEALEKKCVGKESLLAAVGIASQGHLALAKAALQNFRGHQGLEVASGLLRLCAEGPLAGKCADSAVLELFEGHMARIDVLADAKAGRLVAEAALRRGRKDLLAQLMTSTAEASRQVLLLKGLANQRRLADVKTVFDACPTKATCLYNALLDACVDCQDLDAAETIMSEAVTAGMADVVTYNTMIKKHVQRGDLGRARAAIETMRAAGGTLQPNCVTFNELIDATVRANNPTGAWVLIDEMKACGLEPNSVTCSILLKTIQKTSRPVDVERTVAFVDSFEDTMDEILLSSVCEACIRTGRKDLLGKQLQRQCGTNPVKVNGAHTFGSLIRAYGLLGDLSSTWELWREMRSRDIVPTSITIGCMVEALVSSGDCEDGLKLIHELLADGQTRNLVNAVIYCSVVKGFCHQKRFDRVWAVHAEMLKEKVEFSITTYNALIDACARSCQMSRVAPLMEDMSRNKVEANVVTYSTILKGYCTEGRLEKAFELLGAMKQSDRFRPDEITYNTLIDGCAQRGLYDQGIKLVEEMQEANVSISTFTLTVLAKLAGRSKKVDRAFELCESLSKKYRIRLNVHVYNNLIHACTTAGQRPRAMQVLEQMLQERVRPDPRTFKLILQSCMHTREAHDAGSLIRSAVGLRGGHPRLARFESHMVQPRGGLPTELLSEVLEGIAGCDERMAIQLLKDLRTVPGVRLDSKLLVSLTSRAIRTA